MPDYRRAKWPGGTFFFTVVTHERRCFLTEPLARVTLREAFRQVKEEKPFVVVASCLLPDHLHCIWSLPEGDTDYSGRWVRIKGAFTHSYLSGGGREGARNPSRARRGEAAVWQRRFWEHLVRDEEDLARRLDYIHFNPVKHGYVSKPEDWRWSTFKRYVKEGLYDPEWGRQEPAWMTEFTCTGESNGAASRTLQGCARTGKSQIESNGAASRTLQAQEFTQDRGTGNAGLPSHKE